MEKIYKKTLPNGRKIMIKFGYVSGGECYSRFAEASYDNFDRGASYAAFVAADKPDSLTCWECDMTGEFMDRALTATEKKEFENGYLQFHPSKEALDFMTDVQNELTRMCKHSNATIEGFDENCEIGITCEKDEQEVYVEIDFSEGGIITVIGLLNGCTIGQTDLDWSDRKKVIDEAWAAFTGLSNYRDYIHLPRMKGESSVHIETMDALKGGFEKVMYGMLRESFREYVEYLRNLTGDRGYFLAVKWQYKQDWCEMWASFVDETNAVSNTEYSRALVWEALGYYAYESHKGRFMCNDIVAKYMLPEFAVENQVIYHTTCACAPNTTDVTIYENMDVVNNPVHRIGEKICKLANERKDEVDRNDIITLNWDIFGEDDAEFIKNNMPHITSYVYDYSRGIGVIDGVHLSGEDTEIKRLDVASNGLVVYM